MDNVIYKYIYIYMSNCNTEKQKINLTTTTTTLQNDVLEFSQYVINTELGVKSNLAYDG